MLKKKSGSKKKRKTKQNEDIPELAVQMADEATRSKGNTWGTVYKKTEGVQNEERPDIPKEDKHQVIETEISLWGKVRGILNVVQTEEEKEQEEHTREKPIEPMETQLFPWGNMEAKSKIARVKQNRYYVLQMKEQTTELDSFSWEKTGARPKNKKTKETVIEKKSTQEQIVVTPNSSVKNMKDLVPTQGTLAPTTLSESVQLPVVHDFWPSTENSRKVSRIVVNPWKGQEMPLTFSETESSPLSEKCFHTEAPTPIIPTTDNFQTLARSINAIGTYNIRLVCTHFARENNHGNKVCQNCHRSGLVSFQFRNKSNYIWQPIRPSPPYTRPYELCRHVDAGRPCVVGKNCKFAHGREELLVWNKLKDQDLVLTPGTTAATTLSDSLQSPVVPDCLPYTENSWLSKTENVPLSEKSFHAEAQMPIIPPRDNFQTLARPINRFGTYNIRLVCTHFTTDYSLGDKVCRNCRRSGLVSFQFRNKRKAFWQPIRPSPPYTRPYEICRHVDAGRPCVVGENCKFAHGKEELFVWNKLKDQGLESFLINENTTFTQSSTTHQQFNSENTPYCDMFPPLSNEPSSNSCKLRSSSDTNKRLSLSNDLQTRSVKIIPKDIKGLSAAKQILDSPMSVSSTTPLNTPSPPSIATHYRYRKPLQRVKNGAYQICKWWKGGMTCRFGNGCQFAHGFEELQEWKQRYIDKQKIDKQKENTDLPRSILERVNSKNMMDTLPGVELICEPEELKVFLSEDKAELHKYSWTFQVRFKPCISGVLKTIALLHRYHHHYKILKVVIGYYPSCGGQMDQYVRYHSLDLAKENSIEYNLPPLPSLQDAVLVQLKVDFESTIFGSFAQCLLFNFGRESFLVQRMNVDVQGSREALDELKQIRNNIVLQEQMWDDGTVDVVSFQSKDITKQEALVDISVFRLPQRVENIVSAQMIKYDLNVNNYKRVLHQLLFAEEMFMRKQLARFSLTNTPLHTQRTVFSDLSGMVWATENELFGILKLQYPVIPDASSGRLFRRNVMSVLLRLSQNSESKRVYEALIHQVEEEEDSLVLRLPSPMVKDYDLYDGCDVEVDAQFQINRTYLCEMHMSIERLGVGHLNLLFPQQCELPPKAVDTLRLDWLLDNRLNSNQRNVISAIVHRKIVYPLVVFGPFGTGKTLTLSQAVRQLVSTSTNRVLVCTHSNRAADKHVELLDDYITNKNGLKAAKPLRIYESSRRIETTSKVVKKYCLENNGKFVLPSRDDVLKHRVVVTALSTSRILFDLKLGRGFFSHILIDEAAQALEPETVSPVTLAGPNTKIVFTGDHMQMSPEIYSKYARKWGLERSLPERLFDCYQSTKNERFKDAHVMFLTENYRCNKEILEFPSHNFYGEKLVCRSNQPAHPRMSPLLFFTARGFERKEHDHSYLNAAEVSEVVKRVSDLADDWPAVWGPKDLKQVAVLAAYQYQVQAIRAAFRKEGKREVTVDTIHNVQGDEFRAVFITTVRTSITCKPLEDSFRSSDTDEKLYFEFLSDPKLMNTAITRAKSLVAVVGDPVSLCTVGGCQWLWYDYIKRCNEKGGLFGIEMIELKREIKNSFRKVDLNPDAPEFMPSDHVKTKDLAQESSRSQPEDDLAEEEFVQSSSVLLKPQDEIPEKSLLKRRESNFENQNQEGDLEEEMQNFGMKQELPNEEEVEEGEENECKVHDEVDPSYNLDFYDDDITVSPLYMDEIIIAFIKKCEETLRDDEENQKVYENEEFPALEASKVTLFKPKDQRKPMGVSGTAHRSQSLSNADFEIRQVNGRTVIHLVNLGLKTGEPRRTVASSNYQDYFASEVLYRLLKEEPLNYISCSLRINPDRIAYAEVNDTVTPDIQIKGTVRQAFNRDVVVVKTCAKEETNSGRSLQGKVVGILEHVINHRERQYVCFFDMENGALMEPINKSVTRIVILTDQTYLPIYQKQGKKPKVKMMKHEKALSGNYLFLVDLLQWRADCRYPLGIVVKEIKIGVDFLTNLEIIFAEHGIKRGFRNETLKEVQTKYPSAWRIPEREYCLRGSILDNVFTIDSSSSKDLDDALSLEEVCDSCFKVGIHISDVSFFVQSNTELDKEARFKCTSYYPPSTMEEDASSPGFDKEYFGYVKTCIPMLPPQLSENICSLLPKSERLAVSIFVTLTASGEVRGKPDIRRTIVRSCCRLDYATVQSVIEGADDDSVADVSDSLKQNILALNSLAQKRRRNRLGDAALCCFANSDTDVEAHSLVEEMMILANMSVAELLNESIPHIAPFRIQLPPKQYRVQEWLQRYKSIAECSVSLPSHMEHAGVSSTSNEEESRDDIILQEHIWSAICKHAQKGDIKKVKQLLCDEKSHPQLAVAHAQWRRIQARSQFQCGNQEEICHASLGKREHPYYTNFTSPIRRYSDILVHRLLIILLAHDVDINERYSQDDVYKLCLRLTFFSENSRKFNKECKRAALANRLRERSYTTCAFIDAIDERSVTLHLADSSVDHLSGKQKRIQFSHLGPLVKAEKNKSKVKTTLTWKIRAHLAPSLKGVDSKEDASELKNVFSKTSKGTLTLHLQRKSWMAVLSALKTEDEKELAQAIIGLENESDVAIRQSGDVVDRSAIYRHPHSAASEQLGSSLAVDEDNCLFYKTMEINEYGVVQIQLSTHMVRGLLSPEIQLLHLSPELSVCLEHHRFPRECFVGAARRQASRPNYESIAHYIGLWEPLVAIEAATDAVTQNDGFLLKGVSVLWCQGKHENKQIEACFNLPLPYIKRYQLDFFPGDFACLCIANKEVFDNKPHKINRCTSTKTDTSFQDKWVCHCIIKSVARIDNVKAKEITLSFHQAASQIPDCLLDGKFLNFDVEIIHRSLPFRKMYNVLANCLEDADLLVHSICMGTDPSEVCKSRLVPRVPEVLSFHKKSFPVLNRYQEAAVREALVKPLTLIQGPPGTGKTLTGVHIAYWFVMRNRELEEVCPISGSANDSGDEECNDEDIGVLPGAPRQVMYCGPSNKSVDVVVQCLLQIFPAHKILRIYSSLYEQMDFPIPNKINPQRGNKEDQIEISNEVKKVALHHVIRRHSPQAKELKEMEQDFDKEKQRGEKPSQADVNTYCKLISEATKWAIQDYGAEIILCTCIVAGGNRVRSFCNNIQQCIVDESGMSMEPETLVPITCSGARQVVLIGDHKQLQPVIQDNVARSLDLEVSMFERLSKRALMLEIQYRMHSAICEFPSHHFYESRLKTADSVKGRDCGPVKFWPSLRRFNGKFLPIVFCHVEGEEESTAISSSNSNEDSKSNKKEVSKAVQVAKFLVLRHDKLVTMKDVVIISPYREQRNKLSEELKGAFEGIEVTTVAKSQGSEWDYVIISLVRSIPEDEIDPEPSLQWLRAHLGFVTDQHQMNVALTRAKRGLCIIGNKKLLRVNKMWKKLIEHYEENGCVVDEREWP